MSNAKFRWFFRVVAVSALAVLLGGLAEFSPAQAREKMIFVGGGFSNSKLSGGLNENVPPILPTNDSVNGPIVYGTNFESGGGFAFQVGFVPSRFIGVEVLLTATSHDATNAFQFPGERLDAALAAQIVALRLMLPLGDSFEIFGRAGFGAYGLAILKNVVFPGRFFREDSTFSGTGRATGGGVFFTLGRVGIEVGVTTHDVTFDEVETDGITYSIPDIDMTVTTTNLLITAHFGPGL